MVKISCCFIRLFCCNTHASFLGVSVLHVLQNRPFWAKNGCFSGCRRNTAMMQNQITSILIFCLLSFFYCFSCIFLLSLLSHFLIAVCIPRAGLLSVWTADCGSIQLSHATGHGEDESSFGCIHHAQRSHMWRCC